MRRPFVRVVFAFLLSFSILLFLSVLIRDLSLQSLAVVIVLAVFATAWLLHSSPRDNPSPGGSDEPDEPDVPYDPGRYEP